MRIRFCFSTLLEKLLAAFYHELLMTTMLTQWIALEREESLEIQPGILLSIVALQAPFMICFWTYSCDDKL